MLLPLIIQTTTNHLFCRFSIDYNQGLRSDIVHTYYSLNIHQTYTIDASASTLNTSSLSMYSLGQPLGQLVDESHCLPRVPRPKLRFAYRPGCINGPLIIGKRSQINPFREQIRTDPSAVIGNAVRIVLNIQHKSIHVFLWGKNGSKSHFQLVVMGRACSYIEIIIVIHKVRGEEDS